ncbi:rho guanine nucleotide exchange factor 7-like [Hetaerina americana]|uniref:rho guanine nucleotide exchange factor 7-like n=1 Tax=Hetaerina americana TaxID=62018 RepID=UPI003A7F5217
MAMEGGPYLVQAIFSFKGKNNDELCFRKGDVITITQMEEGGWWEGTLEGKTGWFPANYVQEYKQQVPLPQGDVPHLPGAKGGASPISPGSPMQGVAAQRAYRHVVLADMVESERVHVTELNTLLNSYLNPLQKSQLLTAEEYAHLVGNLPVVLDAHEQLLCGLEAELSVEESQEPGAPSRVGRLFLSSAQLLKTVHANYCAGHPRAVCLLEKYRDELGVYMESRGATPPGLLVLTTGLSRPFRRLDKYAGMLQELERHLGEGHPDSGDTQRSVSIYGEVASGCCALRRQKELELEVLRGGIRGWEGEDLHTLGEILHMGSVAVGPDHRDRHLLLFPSTLLILSASQRMSAFIYEGKLPLSGISVTKLEDTDICKNAFEIAGPMIEHIVAQCQSKEDQAKWVSLLNHHINIFCKISMTSGSGVSSPSTAPVLGSPPPLPPTTTSPTGSTKSQKVSSSSVGVSNSTQAAKHASTPASVGMGGLGVHPPLEPPPPRPASKGCWRLSCLRPSPPMRPCLALGWPDATATLANQVKRRDEQCEEGTQILRVIEAYCTGSKMRNTVNSVLLDCPQVLIAEEEKIIVEGPCDNGIVEERSLVDTVYALKEDIQDLTSKVTILGDRLDEEGRARRALAALVQAHIVTPSPLSATPFSFPMRPQEE